MLRLYQNCSKYYAPHQPYASNPKYHPSQKVDFYSTNFIVFSSKIILSFYAISSPIFHIFSYFFARKRLLYVFCFWFILPLFCAAVGNFLPSPSPSFRRILRGKIHRIPRSWNYVTLSTRRKTVIMMPSSPPRMMWVIDLYLAFSFNSTFIFTKFYVYYCFYIVKES